MERRDRVVLQALVVRSGLTMPADEIADALWPDRPPRTWPKVVQGSVSRLRRELGSTSIATVQGGYRLDLAPADVDVNVFSDVVAAGRRHESKGEDALAFEAFDGALALWRGRALPDLLDWAPGRDEIRRLDELRQLAEEERIVCGVRAGMARDLVADAQQLTELSPERERRWQALGLALYASGRQVEALEAARAGITYLRDQFGIEPNSELAQLELAVLRQDPSIEVPSAAGRSALSGPTVLPPAPNTVVSATRRRSRHAMSLAMLAGCVALVVGMAGDVGDAVPSIRAAEPWLVFTAPGPNGLGNLYMARPDGTELREVLTEPLGTDVEVQQPDWSPDGSQIAFEVLGTGAGTPSASVWLTAADGRSPEEVARCDADPCRQFSQPAWSRDGRSLAMVRADLYSDGSCCLSAIVVLDPATGEIRPVFELIEESRPEWYFVLHTPTWSPDGQRLAVTVERYGVADPYPFVDSRIAIIDAGGSVPQQPRYVTPSELNAWHPDWHPTDDLIVFSTFDPDLTPIGARSDLYVVESDGAGLMRLTDDPANGSDRFLRPRWSPDGETVFLSIGRAGSGGSIAVKVVAAMPATGGVPQPVAGEIRGADVTMRPVGGTFT